MRYLKRCSIFALLLLCLTLLPAVTANAGFRKVGRNYRYYTSNTNYLKGTFKNIKTYTYYFDPNGNMVTGWKQIQTKVGLFWYYFDRNGRMLKNRTKNGHYLQKNGRMLTNDWHNDVYYGSDGSAIANYKPDVKSGFRKKKKGIKYKKADGTFAQKEWICVKDSEGKYYWYYFYSSGYMAKKAWIGSRHVDKNGRLDQKRKS